jgi:hypothetical protein
MVDGTGGIESCHASSDEHRACLRFEPSFPPMNHDSLLSNTATGHWSIDIDDTPSIVGGNWPIQQNQNEPENDDSVIFYYVGLDVTHGRCLYGLPPLMKVVTTLVSVFRTCWPETYRWKATVRRQCLVIVQPEHYQEPGNVVDNKKISYTMVAQWERTSKERGESYCRAFGHRNTPNL